MDFRSERKLSGVHPDLVRVVRRAANDGAPSFLVIEGLRTLERQKQLKAKGASKTLNSRHLTGHAVDIVPLIDGEISWAWPNYYPLAKAIKAAAKAEGVPIEWGGDWRSFKDGPHWQLPWKAYSATVPVDDAPMKERTDTQARIRSASLFSTGSGSGAALSEAAGQIAPLTEISDVLKWVFIGLTIAGVAYGLYAWWKGRG